MSEHPGLEFAPQSPRSQILPSMSPLASVIYNLYRLTPTKNAGPGVTRWWRLTSKFFYHDQCAIQYYADK